MQFYNVIFIDGVRKIGKSSQCVLLRQLFMEKKRVVEQMNLDRPLKPAELNEKVNEIRQWCIENPEGTLIVNGSLAYSMVYEDLLDQKYGSSYDEFELPMKNFLNLLREVKICNILIKANDYEYLKSRYEETDTYNPVAVSMLYGGFEYFENFQINDFKWQRVLITKYDTILQIHAKILKYLQ